MTEPLRLDTSLLATAGGKLKFLAGEIPPPPPTFVPPGADPVSTAIAGKVAEVVDPVIAALPVTKEELMRYAQNVLNAAGTYDSTDRQLAEEILRRLGEFDAAAGGSGGSAGGAAGAAGAPSAAGMAASPAAGAGQQGGELGQMMGMPMQMAAQAAQIPMQMMGMAAAVPQGIMQGVQSAMQQVGQMSEMGDKDEQKAEDAEQEGGPAEKKPEEAKAEPTPRLEQAAPGITGGERAPEPERPQAQPQVAPRPAPTRPAESSPEIAL